MKTESKGKFFIFVGKSGGKHNRLSACLTKLGPAGGIALMVLAWELLTVVLAVPHYLIPRPSNIGRSMVDQWPYLRLHAWVTIMETLGGFTLGAGTSIVFALFTVYVPAARRVITPYLTIIQAVPKVALAPLFVIWFGFGLQTNIIFTALLCFFPVFLNLITGLQDVNESEQRLMESYNASKWQVFCHVHIYRALPYLFAGFKLSSVLAVIGAVVSEFYAGDSGLGYYMVQMQNQIRTKETFAALVLLTAIALLFFELFDQLQAILTPWGRSKRAQVANVV